MEAKVIRLIKRLGRRNLNVNDVQIEMIEDIYNAFCIVCKKAIIIQEKTRNVINPHNFYAHVETYFDDKTESDDDENEDENNESVQPRLETQRASSSAENENEPPQKRRSVRNKNVSS